MSGDDKMLERVRRLLAKAEGAATESERDAYNGKAAELIARYGIEVALLAAMEARLAAAGGSRRRARCALRPRQGVAAVGGLRPAGRAGRAVLRPRRGRHPVVDAPVRDELRPRPGRRALHLAAGAGGARAGRRPACRCVRVGGGVPALLDDRLRLHDPAAAHRGRSRRPKQRAESAHEQRRAAPARRSAWSWPTGRPWSTVPWLRPIRACARRPAVSCRAPARRPGQPPPGGPTSAADGWASARGRRCGERVGPVRSRRTACCRASGGIHVGVRGRGP